LNAVALLVVSHFVAGFNISNFVSALIAVIVIGLLNATLGLLLKIITLPLGILSFGLFFWVINAVVLWFTQMVRRLIFPGRSCRQIQGGSSTCRFDRLVLTLARRPFTWWPLVITARCC
jgi:uncharacterized membrane protein YvlD (DUF360 family)